MRAIPTVLGVVLLAGCAQGPMPNRFSGPAPAQAFNCVTERLGALQFRQVSGASGSGSARLERMNDEPWLREIIGFHDTVDVVDVISTSTQLQLNVYSQVVDGDERSAAPPSWDVRSQASEIFAACT